jgi:hypothetical protein
MARDPSIVWVQLATRIPKSLHRELRLHCVTVDTSVMDFVVKAIEEKIAGSGGVPPRGAGRRRRATRDEKQRPSASMKRAPAAAAATVAALGGLSRGRISEPLR